MALLLLFALLAGAATAITPCVLPVLPALLSASATGGRRRPLGIILGLTATFTLTIAVLATVVDGVGLANGATRWFAVVVLVGFGIAIAVPAVGDRIEAPLSRLARFAPRSSGTGFWSGIVVGAALGFAYAPCAGPILAAVVSVGATRGATGQTVAIALAYGAGSAAVLLLLAHGGRAVLERVRRAGRGPVVQRVLGAVMVLTAIALATNADVRFQSTLANDLPAAFSNPTRSLERSKAVEDRLAKLRGDSRFDSNAVASAHVGSYPSLGRAPDFTGNQQWFDTQGDKPLTLKGLRGRVVLVDFWTYTCINCLRTLPYVEAWSKRYQRDGLTVVGVHTPEFPFERNAANVKRAIASNHLTYPVAQDNDYKTWNAWGNQYWPAKYLIDAKGRVRYTHFGEGDYGKTEGAIRALLAEAGHERLGARARAKVEVADPGVQTPETYVAPPRAKGYAKANRPRNGTHDYPAPGALKLNQFALGGRWSIDRQSGAAGARARLDAHFGARKVYLVLSSRGDEPRTGRVLLDGKPIAADDAGDDVHDGRLTVRDQRLYRLVALRRAGDHRLSLRLPEGVSAYAFTFG